MTMSHLPLRRQLISRPHSCYSQLALVLLVGVTLNGCSGGSGGRTNESAALRSGSLMFINAQLRLYSSSVGWVDLNNDTHDDHLGVALDGISFGWRSYVSLSGPTEILGPPREIRDARCTAAADFNLDGALDIACMHVDDGSFGAFDAIAILFQDSAGNFGSPVDTGAIQDPVHVYALATGDFVESSFPDLLAVVDTPMGFQLFTLAGHGDGAFTHVATTEPTTNGFFEGVVADVNNDGFDDLIEGLEIKLSQGDGTFGNTIVVPGANAAADLADFDSDGYLDLVTLEIDGLGSTDQLTLRWGDATASYADSTAVTMPASFGVRWVEAVEDLNGDGLPDLVVRGENRAGRGAWPEGLYVLYGSGGGEFDTPQSLPVELFYHASDFDRDGIVDLLGSTGTGFSAIVFGSGDGTFSQETPPEIPGFNNIGLVSVEDDSAPDLDGDGHLDLLARGGSNVLLRYGRGDGNFDVGQPIPAFQYRNPIDLDGDGDLDYWLEDSVTGVLTVWRTYARDDIRVLPPIALGLGAISHNPAFLDIDGDGHLDLYLSSETVDGILYGLGDLRFEPIRILGPTAGMDFPAMHDINGDGQRDIVSYDGTNFALPPALDGFVARLNTGVRSFAPPVFTPTDLEYWTDNVQFADLNGDGRTDAITVLEDANTPPVTLRTFHANTDGTFVQSFELTLPGFASSARPFDVDGDGDVDVVAMTIEFFRPNVTLILLNDGNGGFTIGQEFQTLPDSSSNWLRDLTGEGVPEVVSMNSESGLSVSLGLGDGSFNPPYFFDVGSTFDLVFGDFDEDGDTDIVAVSTSRDSLNYLENRYVSPTGGAP